MTLKPILVRALPVVAFAAAAVAAAPAAAQAQDSEALPDRTSDRPADRNSLTIGAGAAYIPSYEGSDDYIVQPIGVAMGKVSGISFITRGPGIAIDLIPDAEDAPITLELGPVAYVRLDRTARIKDAQVRALGEIDTAIELGFQTGIAKQGVLHQYDSLGIRATWQYDLTDTHKSAVFSPSIEYSTPLSTRTYATLSASAEHVGDGYARTYFSVSPAGSLASGLPVYNANSGWKSMRLGLFLAQTLTGDLRNPGLSLFGAAAYSRLQGDFKRSPIVSIAGDADQFSGLLGLAYTF
ncbi:MipA/OmpV family protein [Sphingomonas parva]|uniref:MipA/OmpV family protein n=1 Tax=Sphingomonas parva TaxID=2555898 RepID=UPI00142F7D6B|nr:MipA/OmpV family protein [Sphingomonas parva]